VVRSSAASDVYKRQVFSRLREIETRVAIGVGLAIGLSFLIPFVINAAAPKLHFEHSPSAQLGK
jgi:hypothetical protein